MGIGASGGGSQEHAREESRSLQDLIYVIFEELFERPDLIRDVTEMIENPDSWKGGAVHNTLNEGMIIRYTGRIQILDPQFVNSRIEQFIRLMSGIAGAQVGEVSEVPSVPPSRSGGRTVPGSKALKGEEAREAAKAILMSQLFSGSPPGQIRDIAASVAAFTNDAISVRVLPCGSNYPEYHFAGTLLSRSEYIQEEREALFGRYGIDLDNWTVVMQVARVPSYSPPSAPDFNRNFVGTNDQIDRASFERMVMDLIKHFERIGLSEGARYPAVSATILAIYREFF